MNIFPILLFLILTCACTKEQIPKEVLDIQQEAIRKSAQNKNLPTAPVVIPSPSPSSEPGEKSPLDVHDYLFGGFDEVRKNDEGRSKAIRDQCCGLIGEVRVDGSMVACGAVNEVCMYKVYLSGTVTWVNLDELGDYIRNRH